VVVVVVVWLCGGAWFNERRGLRDELSVRERRKVRERRTVRESWRSLGSGTR